MNNPVIGVDISKEWFDIFIPEAGFHEQFENSAKGFKSLEKKLKKLGIVKARVCMEATGLYFEPLAEYLHSANHEVVVVNPQSIKQFAGSYLKRSKTDRIDAQVIAQFCQERYDKVNLWKPVNPVYKKTRQLLRRRAELVAQATAEKNRLQAGFSCQDTIDSIKRSICWLKEETKKIEELVKKLVDTDERLSHAVSLILSAKGIGWLTAVSTLVEVPEVLWQGRLAAAFAGVVPHQTRSGKSQGTTRLSKVGNSHIRQILYMPALTAAHSNPTLKIFYQRLLSRGLKKKQAIAAVMRKLLHLIFGILKSGLPFDEHYELNRKLRLS